MPKILAVMLKDKSPPVILPSSIRYRGVIHSSPTRRASRSAREIFALCLEVAADASRGDAWLDQGRDVDLSPSTRVNYAAVAPHSTNAKQR